MSIKVMLVDDHRILREGLKALLKNSPDIEVVAEASDGREAIEKASEARPEVIVMDLVMPVLNGIEATQRILADLPSTNVLILSSSQERANVTAALKAGAKGYLGKECVIAELEKGIRAVAAGKSYLDPRITDLLINMYTQKNTQDALGNFVVLSKREQDVLRHTADGRNTKDIAFTLNISVKTVETHRLNIMKKLNVNSIAALTKYAVREGLTSLW
ncbi:DNA-binding response regulator [Geomonas silvestris]|uniref:DNA-binding response regulator n=1 Tax=Geomonas silvestris TaxID=2740184 RepID=A0A6V8MGZ0_9BACT|nr:response regulator transcription factor [Geomonas silvestris]GFO59237.1 DNA-binding response regulator [Geomonas silvestris]